MCLTGPGYIRFALFMLLGSHLKGLLSSSMVEFLGSQAPHASYDS